MGLIGKFQISLARISLEKVAAELSGSRRITVSVEGIVTSHGLFVGPDRIGAFRRIQEEQRADSFLAAKLASLRDSSTADMTKELNVLAAASPGTPISPIDRDFYTEKLSSTARRLLTILGRDGRESVLKALSRLQNQVVVWKPEK
jgi:hypothetical protein